MLVGKLHRGQEKRVLRQSRAIFILCVRFLFLQSRAPQVTSSYRSRRESAGLTSNESLSVGGNGSLCARRVTSLGDAASRDSWLHGSTTSTISALLCSSDTVCAVRALFKPTAVSAANDRSHVRCSGTGDGTRPRSERDAFLRRVAYLNRGRQTSPLME